MQNLAQLIESGALAKRLVIWERRQGFMSKIRLCLTSDDLRAVDDRRLLKPDRCEVATNLAVHPSAVSAFK